MFFFYAKEKQICCLLLFQDVRQLVLTTLHGRGSSEFEKLFGELLRSAFLIRKDLTQGAKIISWASKASRLDKESQKSFFRFSIELIRQSFLKNINATSLVNFEAKTDFNFDSFSKYVTKNNIEELCGNLKMQIIKQQETETQT